jgi:hypothetical protein
MNTALNQQGLLPGQSPIVVLSPSNATPAGQPFKSAPWYYGGTETVGSAYSSDVVDWVLVSVRTNPTDTTTKVFETAALLKKNGTVTLVSACPSLNPTLTYYVAVEHRNHLGAISHVPLTISSNQITYDFTQQQSYIPSNVPSSGQIKVGSVYCLMGGDGNKAVVSEINATDNSIWRTHNGTFARYRTTDYNLDGEINALDDSIWRRNNGKFTVISY